MQERRNLLRKKLPSEIPLLEQENDHTLGFLADLSPNGFRITSDGPITEGTELELKMMLPDDLSEVAELDFTAQCCWWEDNEVGVYLVMLEESTPLP